MRGLYLKNLKDFDEELEDISANMTLLKRLQNRLINPGDVHTLSALDHQHGGENLRRNSTAQSLNTMLFKTQEESKYSRRIEEEEDEVLESVNNMEHTFNHVRF